MSSSSCLTTPPAQASSKRSNHAEALVRYAKVMPDGRIAAGRIRQELKMSEATWMRLVKELKDVTSELAKRLSDYGVRYDAALRSASYLTKN